MMDRVEREKLLESFKTLNTCNSFLTASEFTKEIGKKSLLADDGLDEHLVLSLCMKNDISYVLQNSFQSLEDKLKIVLKLNQNPKDFFSPQFNVLIQPEKTLIFQIHPKENRVDFLEKLFQFLEVDMQASRSTAMVQVAEELVMNAQLTAPLQRDNLTPKSSDLKVELGKGLIAFSSFDYYGVLSTEKFLGRIASSYNVGLGQNINYGSGGAGLGSSIIYKNSEALYLGCLPDVCTRVSSVMPFFKGERDLAHIQKSLNVIRV